MKPNGRLDTALAALVQAQATLSQNQVLLTLTQATFVQDTDDFRRIIGRIEERFNRIEAILARHEELLQALPARLKREIGFRTSE